MMYKRKIVMAVLAVFSISLAHYAGFVMQLPLPILAAAGSAMAPGVTAAFLFYLALCSIFARVMVSVMQFIYLPGMIIVDRVRFGKLISIQKKRKYVRTYHELLQKEGLLWFSAQIFITVVGMFAVYANVPATLRTGFIILISVLLVAVAILFRARYFLILKTGRFIERWNKSSTFRANTATAMMVTLPAVLVVIAFVSGALRIKLLENTEPQQVTNCYFSGYARLLVSSGSASLLLQETGQKKRYIYSTPEYVVSVESMANTFPQLTYCK